MEFRYPKFWSSYWERGVLFLCREIAEGDGGGGWNCRQPSFQHKEGNVAGGPRSWNRWTLLHWLLQLPAPKDSPFSLKHCEWGYGEGELASTRFLTNPLRLPQKGI